MSNPAKDDRLDKMMAWEDGTLGETETIALFQQLVNTGVAWQLQGSYGRAAANLLDHGLISSPFQVVGDSDNG